MVMNWTFGYAMGAVALAFVGMTHAMAAPVPLDITDEAGKTLSGDAGQGAQVFHKCQVCHSVKPGENHVGPSLNGVVGRTAGSVAGFNYSPANKSSGIVWTEQKIFDYLQNPQKMVHGTKMTFPGLPSEQDRADVVAYLKENAK
jgi:cytochrome c